MKKIKFCINCGQKLAKSSYRTKSQRCYSCSKKGNLSGLWKGGITLQQYFCLDCGKKLVGYTAERCKSCSKKGELSPLYIDGRTLKKHYCIECQKEISIPTALRGKGRCNICSHQLELNGNWNGGSSFEPYTVEFNKELKEKIRKRDNYECQICHFSQEEHLKKYHKEICIHHIDYNKENCEETNLISLCIKCHLKTNGNRDYWLQTFSDIMEIQERLQTGI